jgi:hypothetical protein
MVVNTEKNPENQKASFCNIITKPKNRHTDTKGARAWGPLFEPVIEKCKV